MKTMACRDTRSLQLPKSKSRLLSKKKLDLVVDEKVSTLAIIVIEEYYPCSTNSSRERLFDPRVLDSGCLDKHP